MADLLNSTEVEQDTTTSEAAANTTNSTQSETGMTQQMFEEQNRQIAQIQQEQALQAQQNKLAEAQAASKASMEDPSPVTITKGPSAEEIQGDKREYPFSDPRSTYKYNEYQQPKIETTQGAIDTQYYNNLKEKHFKGITQEQIDAMPQEEIDARMSAFIRDLELMGGEEFVKEQQKLREEEASNYIRYVDAFNSDEVTGVVYDIENNNYLTRAEKDARLVALTHKINRYEGLEGFAMKLGLFTRINQAEFQTGIIGQGLEAVGVETPESAQYLKKFMDVYREEHPGEAFFGEIATDPLTYSPALIFRGASKLNSFVKSGLAGGGFGVFLNYLKNSDPDTADNLATFGIAGGINGLLGMWLTPAVANKIVKEVEGAIPTAPSNINTDAEDLINTAARELNDQLDVAPIDIEAPIRQIEDVLDEAPIPPGGIEPEGTPSISTRDTIDNANDIVETMHGNPIINNNDEAVLGLSSSLEGRAGSRIQNITDYLRDFTDETLKLVENKVRPLLSRYAPDNIAGELEISDALMYAGKLNIVSKLVNAGYGFTDEIFNRTLTTMLASTDMFENNEVLVAASRAFNEENNPYELLDVLHTHYSRNGVASSMELSADDFKQITDLIKSEVANEISLMGIMSFVSRRAAVDKRPVALRQFSDNPGNTSGFFAFIDDTGKPLLFEKNAAGGLEGVYRLSAVDGLGDYTAMARELNRVAQADNVADELIQVSKSELPFRVEAEVAPTPRAEPTVQERALIGISKIKEGKNLEGLKALVTAKAYTTSEEFKQIVDTMGSVFTSFKNAQYHKFPLLNKSSLPSDFTVADVAKQISDNFNRANPNNRIMILPLSDRLGNTSGYHNFYIYSEKDLGSKFDEMVANKQRPLLKDPVTGEFSTEARAFSITIRNRRGKPHIASIGATNMGSGDAGQMAYHVLQEFAVSKKASIESGGLFVSNRAARPFHLISAGLQRPQLAKLLRYKQGTNSDSFLTNFTSIEDNTKKAQNGLIGNAVLELMYNTQRYAFPAKEISMGSSIPHIGVSDEVLNKFGYDPKTASFTFNGETKTLAEIDKLWKQEADAFIERYSNDPSSGYFSNGVTITNKGFNSQVRVSILSRSLFKDLLNATPDQHEAIAKRYKNGIRNEAKRADRLSPSADDVGGYSSAFRTVTKAGVGFAVTASPMFAASLESIEASGEENSTATNAILTVLAVTAMALSYKKGYKPWMAKRADILKDREYFSKVKQDTVRNLLTSIKNIDDKLATQNLAPTARGKLIDLKNKSQKMVDKIKQYNSIDHIISSIDNPQMQEYVLAKSKPVLQIAAEKVQGIREAFLAGDYKTAAAGMDFNLERIDTTEEVSALMDTVADFVRDSNAERRGIIPLAEVEASAAEMGFNIKDLNNLYADTAELAEKVTAARFLRETIGEKAAEIARKMEAGTASPMDELEFDRLLALHASVYAMTKSSQTEIARALTSMRITSRINRGGSIDEISNILTSLGRTGRNSDIMKAWLTATEGERTFLAKNASNHNIFRKGENALSEFWINSLLSGLSTHLVNIMSNTVTSFEGLFRHMALSESSGEALYHLYGFFRGITEAPGAFYKAAKLGRSQLDFLQKLEHPEAISAEYFGIKNSTAGAMVDIVGNVVRVPGRMLTASDDLFKIISYRMKLHGEAYRAAKNMGLQGDELRRKTEDLITDADFWMEMKNNPSARTQGDIIDRLNAFNAEHSELLDSLYKTSMDVAREQTFTTELGPRANALQLLIMKNPELKFVIPFVRTPLNILKFFGNRIPLLNGIGNPKYRNAIMKMVKGMPMSPEEIRHGKEFMLNSAVGGALLYSSYNLAQKGSITGMAPNNKSGSQQDAGWRPYAIRVPQKDGTYKYVQYSRLDPLGMFIGLAADLNVVFNTTDKMTTTTDEMYSAAMVSFVNNFVNKTYMSGITQLSEAISSENGTVISNYLKNQAASFIPKALSDVAKSIDPIQREALTLTDTLKSRIPGLTQDLQPRYDYAGRFKEGKPVLSPFDVGKTTNKALDNAILETKINFAKPPRAITGTNVEYSPEEYAFYSKTRGELFDKYGTELVTSKNWNRMTLDSGGYEGSKTTMLKKAMYRANKEAKALMFKQFPDLYDKFREARAAAFEHKQLLDEEDVLTTDEAPTPKGGNFIPSAPNKSPMEQLKDASKKKSVLELDWDNL